MGEKIEQQSFSLDIPFKKERILSCKDLYENTFKQPKVSGTKGKRCHYFNSLLTQRITNFSEIASYYALPMGTITNKIELEKSITGEMFHENFHHTEQTIMHYLSSHTGLRQLVAAALRCNTAYFYGIVLDIFTQRMLCCNCNAGLLGLQHSQTTGFLANLGEMLTNSHIQPRIGKNLMLSVRVSASRGNKTGSDPLSLPVDERIVHEYNANNLPQILQASNKALGSKATAAANNFSLSSYQGSFFVSQTFSKKHLERRIALPTPH